MLFYMPQLHLKTDIGFRGFHVQLNAEFPRQVMNFPIEYDSADVGTISDSMFLCLAFLVRIFSYCELIVHRIAESFL